MTRPWKTWLLFGFCCAVLLAAMGWISVTALHLDRLQQHAAERADLEERVRLALWRMDSGLTPIIVEENARPDSAYQPFAPAPVAYTKTLSPVKPGDVILPSPLLAYNSSNVLLHFQLDEAGRLTSPQVLPQSQSDLAIANYTSTERIQEASRRLNQFRELLDQPSGIAAQSKSSSPPVGRQVKPEASGSNLKELTRQVSVPVTNQQLLALSQSPLIGNNDVRQFEQQQTARNSIEFNNRMNFYEQTRQQAFVNNGQINAPAAIPSEINTAPSGPLQPAWLGSELVLARTVRNENGSVVQGLWLNWPSLRAMLLETIKDILPNANLEPFRAIDGSREPRALAALPIRLVPGGIPIESTLAWTAVQVSLAIAWSCVLLAGLAAAFLLHGTLALSERRAVFVSAVTHELRTPLTTFKMYSEMLADGMVTEEEKRKHYLGTLCSEANRLNHLVENVLAYARLERGSARSRLERLTLGDLVQRVKPRLVERAAQAGTQVVEDVDEAAARSSVHVDVSVVEQILFNLVDNACKYAAPTASEKLIHLEAVPENGKFALLRVRDHGQGISAEAAKRLFQPFNKSATEAAHSAPGVGLGLALCRRLSRNMGGDLEWDRISVGGTCFALKLPSA